MHSISYLRCLENESSGAYNTHNKTEKCIEILVAEAEGKEPLGADRWKENMKTGYRACI